MRAAELNRRRDVVQLLEQGEYDEAVSEDVQQVVELAGENFGFQQHVGTLRLMLWKILAVDVREGDPIEPAHAAAMLVKSIVATMRTQRAVEGERVDDIARALDVVLSELQEAGN